jgi:hypothetical protein
MTIRKKYILEFYRASQADSFTQAEEDGAMRIIELDDSYDSLDTGLVADFVAAITKTADMMEAGARINFRLAYIETIQTRIVIDSTQ